VPRFYFHLHNDLDVPDDEGVDLPDLEGAVEYARCSARGTMAQTLKDEGHINFKHWIDVEDGQGNVLATVKFAHSVRVDG
jgi:hypothetical protein